MEVDPVLWKQVEKVVETLDVGAMSSDHTDDASSPKAKSVTRARTPWRSLEIADLMQSLESYPDQRSAAGNRALARTYLLHRAPISNRKAIPKLPINFYDSNWYTSRTQAEKLDLAVQKAVPIPSLVLHVK